jgi:hypothetical protein
MKTLINILIVNAILIYGDTAKTSVILSDQNRKVNNVKLNGVYSLHDVFKDNSGVEAYKKYVYISPILFFEDGNFIQSPHCNWNSINFIERLKNTNERLDFGRYSIQGEEVILKGVFTFFARGMDWRQYAALYEGYFDETSDTLYLKIGKPYPPINFKFNVHLAERLKVGEYQKYVFKPLPKSELDKIDKVFFESITDRKLRP